MPAGRSLAQSVIRRNQANLSDLHDFIPAGSHPPTDDDRLNPLKINLEILMKSITRELAMTEPEKKLFHQLVEQKTMTAGELSLSEEEKLNRVFSQDLLDSLQSKINKCVKEINLNQKIVSVKKTSLVAEEAKKRKKEIEAIKRGEVVDHNNTRFFSPRIYQYTSKEKQKMSINPKEFTSFLSKNY